MSCLTLHVDFQGCIPPR